ncbi:MAG: hypothetical protein ABIL09_10870 [Gemmatimonadota bacterium]
MGCAPQGRTPRQSPPAIADISTVRYQPQRLFQWGEIAMEVAGA